MRALSPPPMGLGPSPGVSLQVSPAQPGFVQELLACKKCALPIYEGHAYELGDDRWHINCFTCSKCGISLGCNSNFLVLGNGNLICSNCSYNCKQCGKKIDDLAILTGDQAYCSNCFKCRLCKKQIEDLRYARTSKGLFCMTCHEKLVAKKKKYDARKKAASRYKEDQTINGGTGTGTGIASAAATPRDTFASDTTSILSETLLTNQDSPSINATETNRSSFQLQNASNTSLRSKVNKSLPPCPDTSLPNTPDAHHSARNTAPAASTAGTPPSGHKLMSTPSSTASRGPNKHRSVASGMSGPSIDDLHEAPSKSVYESIEEVNDSDEELNKRKGRAPAAELPLSSNTNQSGSLIFLDIINTDTFPEDNNNNSHGTNESTPMLQPPLSFSPDGETPPSMNKTMSASSGSTTDSQGTTTSGNNHNNHEEHHSNMSAASSLPTANRVQNDVTATNVNGKNILILSPHTIQEPRVSSHSSQSQQQQPHPHGSDSTLADPNGTPVTSTSISTNDTDSFKNPPSSNSSSKLTPKPDSASSKLDVDYANSRSRSNCSSPLAKANRQARVVEPDYINDEIEGDTSTLNDALSTPVLSNEQHEQQLDHSDPMTPSKPKKTAPFTDGTSHCVDTNRSSSNSARGLGLEGVGDLADYQECIDYLKQQQDLRLREAESTTKTVDPFEQSTDTAASAEANTTIDSIGSTTSPKASNRVLSSGSSEDQQQGSFGRRNTLLKSAKLGLRHKRSLSGGNSTNNNNKEPSSTGKLASFFKSNRINEDYSHTTNAGSASSPPSFHRRQTSESSVHSGTAFATPPLPSPLSHFKDHYRSSSDNSQFLTSLEKISDPEKQQVAEEVRKLRLERLRLNDQLKEIRGRINQESSKLENLAKDVESLEKKKRSLLDSNIVLTKQNQQLEQVLKLEKQISKDHHGAPQAPPLHSSSFETNGSIGSQTVTILDENEPLETSKATRLKFWRRPKVNLTGGGGGTSNSFGSNGYGNNNMNGGGGGGSHNNGNGYGNGYPNNSSNNTFNYSNNNLSGSTAMPSSEMLPLPGDNEKKGSLGTFITKSRSTNILDSFLSGGNNHNSHPEDSSNDQAPLFSTTLQKRATYEGTEVPLIVTKCLAEVEMRGLDTEGIYRISGGNSAIVAIENAFSSLHPEDQLSLDKLEECLSGDINAVTSALKRYLRKLPDPIIPYALYDDFISISTDIPPNKKDRRIGEMRIRVIDRLPPANRQTVFLLCQHLTLIDSYSQINRMGFKNLSVVFAPTLAGDINGEKEMLNMGHRNEMTEFLISNYIQIFED